MSRKNIIVAIFAVLAIGVIATSKPTQQSLQQAQPVAQIQPAAHPTWSAHQLAVVALGYMEGAHSTMPEAECAVKVIAAKYTPAGYASLPAVPASVTEAVTSTCVGH